MTTDPLLSPAELGFPDKFESWHSSQVHAIRKVLDASTRFIALVMPTGSGKSAVGIASILLAGPIEQQRWAVAARLQNNWAGISGGPYRGLYLTSTKGLQDQLSADFSGCGLVDLRGARNYPCRALEPGASLHRYRRGRLTPGCDEGPCHSGVKCSLAPIRSDMAVRPGCDYYGATWDARRANIVSTNYAMYLASEYYADGLGSIQCLVLDEAHDADKELESFLTVEISAEEARRVGSRIMQSADLKDWKDWAGYHWQKMTPEIDEMDQIPPLGPEDAHERRKLKNIYRKLDRLRTIEPLEWIVDSNGSTAKFAPIRVSSYAEGFLFRSIKKVILLSATMTKKTTQLLGIKPADLTFWECPSHFPVNRRPVYSIGTTPSIRVDKRMTDDDKYMWMRRIDRIIEPRRALGWKGIIHTVSYARMKELVEASEHRDIMIVHDTAGTREAIRLFRESEDCRILVSPSMITGYDFPHDYCRWQIIGKVPFPDMRGAIMKVRAELDKDYAGYLAMQKLVQACGRAMRSEDDWSETFIVDSNFEDWFLHRYKKHAPRWFLDALEYVEYFPEPLEVA